MKYVLTGKEMKDCDTFTIEEMQLPSVVLMERAALAAKQEIEAAYGPESRVLVLCGSGNNGGDGFAVARLLLLDGIAADIYFAGKETSLTPETALQKKIFENYGGKYCRKSDFSEYTVLVDALFGIGLSRPITGAYAKLIHRINVSGQPVVALDMPSGISADTGEVLGCGVKAQQTITFAFMKRGQILYPGTEYCGKLVVKDIGITEHSLANLQEPAFTYKKEDLKLLPQRIPRSNKGTYGSVLLIAGGENMAGAAVLSGKSAYRTGCGLVHILAEEMNRTILQSNLPEAVFSSWQQRNGLEVALSRVRVVGVGPGLGTGEKAHRLVKEVLESWNGPLVMDADALNILASHPEYLQNSSAQVIITPHPGEMARLTGYRIPEILENITEVCREYAAKHQIICVLKDARTIVSDGEKLYINTSGNDGMAVGGSGDVLTGIICSLLAQGMEPFKAACEGVYLHGMAGDAAAGKLGCRSMMSCDITEYIPKILNFKNWDISENIEL